MLAAKSGIDTVGFNVGTDNEQRLFSATNVKSLALTDRKLVRALVLAHDLSHLGCVNDRFCR